MTPFLLLFSAVSAQPGSEPSAAAKVQVVEKLGERLPLDLTFTDSRGEAVALSSLLTSERPAVLALVYYRCPTLCGLVLSGLVGSLRQTGLRLGEEVEVLVLSIDHRESPAQAEEKRQEALVALGLPPDARGVRFLVGEEAPVKAVADSVGFGYAYDEELDQYAHAAVLTVLAPGGKVSRYLYGVRYPPKDLKLALLEAAGGKVGTAFDRFLLTCYRYDPASRRYQLYMWGFLRGGALLVFLALAAVLGGFWRRELVARRRAGVDR
ncbi:MAG: SCO family protein [Myxococcales bacterium]|nr:SCO family protein [Myxococcales bacterium]